MTVFLDISAALDGRLNTMTGLPDVAWENYNYTPVAGTLYLRPTNLPGSTDQATLGTAGTDLTTGIYQVDVFAEASKGKNAGLVMADNIANHFKRGTVLAYNGRTVKVTTVRRGLTDNSNGWYQVPVEILYRSYTQARS